MKYVYFFGGSKTEGNASLNHLLGGKGANLAEMARMGIPVPPGFTVITDVSNIYYANNKTYPEEIRAQVEEELEGLEEVTGAKFGDEQNPLVASVRSGARVSMPGMMETILNLGLNDVSVRGLAQKTGNERFAYQSYRRLIEMYGSVVMGVDEAILEGVFIKKKKNRSQIAPQFIQRNI